MTENLRNERGIVSIIALGIFAIMTMLGIIITIMISHNYESVIGMNNYYAASDLAGSAMGFLEQEHSRYDAGYSTGFVTCKYTDGENVTDDNGGIDPICENFIGSIGTKDIKLELEIKGRPSDEEKLVSARCERGRNLIRGVSSDCYVNPLPGTGNAGDRCNMYEPVFGEGEANLPANIANRKQDLDQLDHPCNWNKLSLGTSSNDRVSIPLYYSNREEQINPYTIEDGEAEKFLLRMRTPCLPCVYGDEESEAGVTRHCRVGDDPAICNNNERYVLDGDNHQENNDVLVQWQINGLCADTGEECGIKAGEIRGNTTAVTEVNINRGIENHEGVNYIVLDYNSQGIDVNTGGRTIIGMNLPTFTEAKLNLFLMGALISEEGRNVPYLEYQFLSDKPVASPKTKLETTAYIGEGNLINTFTNTEFIEVDKPLIDFAIQN